MRQALLASSFAAYGDDVWVSSAQRLFSLLLLPALQHPRRLPLRRLEAARERRRATQSGVDWRLAEKEPNLLKGARMLPLHPSSLCSSLTTTKVKMTALALMGGASET